MNFKRMRLTLFDQTPDELGSVSMEVQFGPELTYERFTTEVIAVMARLAYSRLIPPRPPAVDDKGQLTPEFAAHQLRYYGVTYPERRKPRKRTVAKRKRRP